MTVSLVVADRCNAWVVGDDREVIVIDAPPDPDAILAAVDGRRVTAIICTHAPTNHASAAPEVADRTGAAVWLHPAEGDRWHADHPDRGWDCDLNDGQEFAVGAVTLEVIHAPGRAPGGVCIYSPTLGCVFTGDLNVLERLSHLPGETIVHAGHGSDTVLAHG